ncbi:hypothetical protein SEVIR_1G363666v4 [Setaria viridis]
MIRQIHHRLERRRSYGRQALYITLPSFFKNHAPPPKPEEKKRRGTSAASAGSKGNLLQLRRRCRPRCSV